MTKFADLMDGACLGFDYKHNHVPCLAHIINLAAKAAINVLSSRNKDATYLSDDDSGSEMDLNELDIEDDVADELEDLPVSKNMVLKAR